MDGAKSAFTSVQRRPKQDALEANIKPRLDDARAHMAAARFPEALSSITKAGIRCLIVKDGHVLP